MSKSMIVFEDKGDDVVISMENACSDNPTPAQEAVLLLHRRMRDMAKKFMEDIKMKKFEVVE